MRRAALAALALALAAFGCGGDELREFRDDVRPLEERAENQRSVIAVELRTLTLGSQSDARALRELTAELAEIHEEIAALDPPGEYEEPFEAHVRANEKMVRGLRRFAAELAAGDARGLERASRLVIEDLGRSQSARLRWLR